MKSPMIVNAGYIKPEEKGNYTDLMVCQSAAGYYVGTMYEERDQDGNVKWQEPGSRDSDYFSTREAAQSYLGMVLEEEADTFEFPQSNFF